jgi:PAS domain-containing protein
LRLDNTEGAIHDVLVAARLSTRNDLLASMTEIVDDERRFVEVSPALAEIIELPAARIVGHAIEEFAGPDDPTIRSDIIRLWQDFETTGAIASTVRFNFGDGRPRELGYRLIADAAGRGRHRLTVWDLATD